MSNLADAQHRRTGTYYAAGTFGSVVLIAYASYFQPQHYFRSEYWVPVAFALGALHATLGVLAGAQGRNMRRVGRIAAYFVIQAAIVTAIVYVSPSRGFLGIVVFPLLSQAVFDLSPRAAAAVGVYLFAMVCAVWMPPYGSNGPVQAALSYSPGFVFTVAFTAITRRALAARQREASLRREVESKNAQLRDYAAQIEELATTRERNRVAREIHDGVGHYLTVVKTQLDAAAALLPAEPARARDVIDKAAKLAADALDDVRRSVASLRTDTPRAPLSVAVESLTAEAGLPVAFRVEGAPRILPPAVEHALFRAAQEGLTNVRKHAAARTAEVTVDFRATDRVRLSIGDDGRGTSSGESRGFGLQGIRERVEVLGGSVEIGNRPGGGFMLSIDVPA